MFCVPVSAVAASHYVANIAVQENEGERKRENTHVRSQLHGVCEKGREEKREVSKQRGHIHIHTHWAVEQGLFLSSDFCFTLLKR